MMSLLDIFKILLYKFWGKYKYSALFNINSWTNTFALMSIYPGMQHYELDSSLAPQNFQWIIQAKIDSIGTFYDTYILIFAVFYLYLWMSSLPWAEIEAKFILWYCQSPGSIPNSKRTRADKIIKVHLTLTFQNS